MVEFLIGLVAAFIVFGVAWLFAPKGWRTRISNWLMGLFSAGTSIVSYLADFPWDQYLEPKTALGMIIGWAVVNSILREITTTPPGRPS